MATITPTPTPVTPTPTPSPTLPNTPTPTLLPSPTSTATPEATLLGVGTGFNPLRLIPMVIILGVADIWHCAQLTRSAQPIYLQSKRRRMMIQQTIVRKNTDSNLNSSLYCFLGLIAILYYCFVSIAFFLVSTFPASSQISIKHTDGYDCHVRVTFCFGVPNPFNKDPSYYYIPVIYELLKQ